jgi:hypothetical protein
MSYDPNPARLRELLDALPAPEGLQWHESAPGTLEARGGNDQVYLIAWDDRSILLTRYRTEYHGPGRAGRERDALSVARQAAVNAISLDGAYDVAPDARDKVIGHMKQRAGEYEAGGSISDHPAWRRQS